MKKYKPYKGKIYNWKLIPVNPNWAIEEGIFHAGFYVEGFTTKDPHLDTSIRTSLIVRLSKTNYIETLNSRYKLVGNESTPD